MAARARMSYFRMTRVGRIGRVLRLLCNLLRRIAWRTVVRVDVLAGGTIGSLRVLLVGESYRMVEGAYWKLGGN